MDRGPVVRIATHPSPNDVDDRELRTLSLLSLEDGTMYPELVARRKDGRPGTVFIAKGQGHRFVGWAFCYPTPNLGGHDFHVYVDAWKRRQGIGTALYEAAVARHGVVRTFAPDEGARNFYKALKQGAPKPSAA